MLSIRSSRFIVSTKIHRRPLATAAQGVQSFHIPVIDFTQFRDATAQSERKRTADKIVTAFKESGFIYLSGHGIPSSTFIIVIWI